jgi:6-phosphogluconate dehydrogenase
MEKADIGLIGLAVMGQNLVLNLNDKGYKVAVYNRTESRTNDFIKGPAAGRNTIVPCYNLDEFTMALNRPRKIMLMVKAGDIVDGYIATLLPLLEKGDIIIDGGNSHYPDTNKRCRYLRDQGIHFIGMGVSGGEEGARNGPSLMPGGNRDGWPEVKEIFKKVAAKTDSGAACCEWVGDEGSGHYVKMIHNGIEYGDIQLICEAYHILNNYLGLDAERIGEVFCSWNRGTLNSYLIEITGNIFQKKDENGKPLVDSILDTAGQKGTGKWTGINALDLGTPVTLIAEAVFARHLSALKDDRVKASEIIGGGIRKTFSGSREDREAFIEDIRRALLASKIVSYAQGFMLMRAAAEEFGWNLNFGEIALLWREGCIIRSVFLDDIRTAFEKKTDLACLLLDDFFRDIISESEPSWRRVVSSSVEAGVAVPAFSSALAFYDGYRSSRLPANLLQAMRDYFGAHTYERTDRPRGEFFHTTWN